LRTIAIRQPFAVFSDVHGNLPGLEAILAGIDRRGLADVSCLGDLVGYGPFPSEVAALVRDRGIPTLMGNYDQGIGFAAGESAVEFVRVPYDYERLEQALAETDLITSFDAPPDRSRA
jgi:hypothetical protein